MKLRAGFASLPSIVGLAAEILTRTIRDSIPSNLAKGCCEPTRNGNRSNLTAAYLLLFLWVATPLHGQEFLEAESGNEPGHLEPIAYQLEFSDYRKRIEDHLIVTSAKLGLMISKPSYTGESAVAVYETISDEVFHKYNKQVVLVPDSEKSFYITYTQAKESLWMSMSEQFEGKGKEVEIQRHDLEISRDLAAAIQRTWGRMLLQTRYPEEYHSGGGGITYEFGVFILGLGFLRGETWQPESGLPAKLVGLGEKLQQITKKGEALDPAMEDALMEQLFTLERLAVDP